MHAAAVLLKIGNKFGQILKKGLTFLLFYGIIYRVVNKFRGIAQLVEHWSPKPSAEGSSPSAPAKNPYAKVYGFYFFTIHSSLFLNRDVRIFGK